MSEIKIIANGSRRRRLTAAKKLRIIEVKGDRGPRRGHISPQGLEDQASISIFAWGTIALHPTRCIVGEGTYAKARHLRFRQTEQVVLIRSPCGGLNHAKDV